MSNRRCECANFSTNVPIRFRYRTYDKFQEAKIRLLKSLQNAVYAEETVRLKSAIGNAASGDLPALSALIESAREARHRRQREQLRGLHRLYRLCEALGLL
ncbi:hypothetical protein [Cohnella algarum]|uniref:hypothetical protein n=1 Tax=Cohnella algarum TaxID=2044859 RepID=UPI0019681628|nr:hypothetical protein [Cohnella algarum]MBN2983513.1 hypothetical protein [Cohnella algarum]